MLFNGNRFVDELLPGLQERVDAVYKSGLTPHLSIVTFSGNRSSGSYIKSIEKLAKRINVHTEQIVLNEQISQHNFEETIGRLNRDSNVNGVLVDMPLPAGLSADWLKKNLSYGKDVDAVTYGRKGELQYSSVAPSTPKAIINIIMKHRLVDAGEGVVVIGRSDVVGMPLAIMLLRKGIDATVTVCHSRTKDLAKYTSNSRVVVVAAGSPWLIGKADLAKGAAVIDAGVSVVKEGNLVKIRGDVNPDGLDDHISFFTPVPGGVGPVTTYSLFENLVELCMNSLDISK